MPREPYYEAHWYHPNDCVVDGEFDPYRTTVASFDTLDQAQRYAIKGAAAGGFYHGWAAVYELVPDEYGASDITKYLVNEVFKNKWCGWEDRTAEVSNA